MKSTKPESVQTYFPTVDFDTLDERRIQTIANLLQEDSVAWVITRKTWSRLRLGLTLLLLVSSIICLSFWRPSGGQSVNSNVTNPPTLTTQIEDITEPTALTILQFLKSQSLRPRHVVYWRQNKDRPNLLVFDIKGRNGQKDQINSFLSKLDTSPKKGRFEIHSEERGFSWRYYYSLEW